VLVVLGLALRARAQATCPTARQRNALENKAPQPNRTGIYPTPPNLSDTARIAVAWSIWIRSSNAMALQSSVKLFPFGLEKRRCRGAEVRDWDVTSETRTPP
jgi:hypothetical protein